MSERLLREYIAASLSEQSYEDVDELIGRLIGGAATAAKGVKKAWDTGQRLGASILKLDLAGFLSALGDMTPSEIKLFMKNQMYGVHRPEYREELRLKLDKDIDKKEIEMRELHAKIENMKASDKIPLPDGSDATKEEAKAYGKHLQAEWESLRTARSEALYFARTLGNIEKIAGDMKGELTVEKIKDGESKVRKLVVDYFDDDSTATLAAALKGDPSDPKTQAFYGVLVNAFGGNIKMSEENVEEIQGHLARELTNLEKM